MSRIQIVQLARIVATSHVYFALVRPSCVELRPCNSRLYRVPEDEETWSSVEPLALRPYLFIGFGQKPPRKRIGATSSVGKAYNSSMIQLGLMLYQVGTAMNIDYGIGRNGLVKAKIHVMNSLGALDETVGPGFTEIVQMCLDYKTPDFRSGAEDENNLVKKMILCLLEYEERLEQTLGI